MRPAALLLAGVLLVPLAAAMVDPGRIQDAAPGAGHASDAAAAPAAVAGRFTFTNVTEAAGIDFVHAKGGLHSTALWMQYISGGVAVGDYDGDGDDDLYFPNGWEVGLEYMAPPHTYALERLEPLDQLYRNEGGGRFTRVTRQAGLGDTWASNSAGFADYDGDGDMDLTVSGFGRLVQYRNEGDGTFTDVSAAVGIGSEGKCGARPCFSTSFAWADPDHDGDIDLYVGNYVGLDLGPYGFASMPGIFPFQGNLYFRNRGNGTFDEVAAELGLRSMTGHALGVLWIDIDNDGWEDLFVANDYSPNTLYRNNGDGTFTDISAAAGINLSESSMGIAAGDFDFDGDDDLVVTEYTSVETEVFINRGDGTFQYVTGSSIGLGSSLLLVGWGTEFFDMDLDADLDLFIVNGDIGEGPLAAHDNLLYEWRGDGRYHDVTDLAGDFRGDHSSRAATILDFDLDGDDDVVVANTGAAPPYLLRNDVERRGNSLQLMVGQPEGNTMALGAKVRVQPLAAGVPALTKEVRAGTSYESGNSRLLTWGLGPATAAAVTVTWPGGAQSAYTLDAGQAWVLERGAPPRPLR